MLKNKSGENLTVEMQLFQSVASIVACAILYAEACNLVPEEVKQHLETLTFEDAKNAFEQYFGNHVVIIK